jgi:predicted enzyme related to lactoylglutathione lyase
VCPGPPTSGTVPPQASHSAAGVVVMADGVPCWADLTIGDAPDGVTAFYGTVLGWTFTDDAAAAHHDAVALTGGRRVAGIGGPEGSPPGWTLYFAVEDAADAADRLEEAGGSCCTVPTTTGEAVSSSSPSTRAGRPSGSGSPTTSGPVRSGSRRPRPNRG